MTKPSYPSEPLELPTAPAALAAMLLAERAARLAEREARLAKRDARIAAEADSAEARAGTSSRDAMITYLQLMIEKLKRELYGQSSERGTQKLDQLQLQLEECEPAATETRFRRS